MSDFDARLAAMGLGPHHFRRAIARLTGKTLDRKTTSRWSTGKHPLPILAPAVLRLLELLPQDLRDDLTLPDGQRKPAKRV